MPWRQTLLAVSTSFAVVTAASAGPFEGEWIGGFQGKTDPVFIEVRIGGEGSAMAGRADLPMIGEEAIPLRDIRGGEDRLSFEIPGYRANLIFDVQLKGRDRVQGSVRQEWVITPFEMLRTRGFGPSELRDIPGDYLGASPDDVVFLYRTGNDILYVDYATGRAGRLFCLGDGRFVSGPSVLAGYPIELTATFEHDGEAGVSGLVWQRKGEGPRRLRRRTLYRVDEARFVSGPDTTLAGLLLVPDTRGPHPAVVIVPGSGQVTAEMLLPYADSLARHGVAVLVHDKRGVGQSAGSYARAGISELADDALAGVDWLQRQSSINAEQIGLVGASLGGWAAPLAASRNPAVKFLIVESAPAITPAEHERLRVQNQMRADGQPREMIAIALRFMDLKLAVGRTGKGWDGLEALAGRARREGWARYVNPSTSLESLEWNWQNVLSYNPEPVLKQLRVPILALYGGLDRIVDSRFNKSRLEGALRTAGNRDVTIRVFPAANHNFYAAITGGPREFPRLKGYVGGYFEARIDWLLAHVESSATVAALDVRRGAMSPLVEGVHSRTATP
jgi:dienelactone hydrolase